MYIRAITLFSVSLLFLLSSCSPEHSEIVLSEFNNQEIKMKEFEDAYAKNSGGIEQAKKDSLDALKNFLNLYTNFKMKLRDAEVRGFDTNEDLHNELLNYKKKVGITLLLDSKIVEPGIRELYDKRKYELEVSHIMFKNDTSNEKESLDLASSVLDSIKNGADFGEMAKKYSADFYSKSNGGNIGYITAGLLPASFEDAAYKTEVGKVYPEVVKTKFGYHIIKVTDKINRIPEVKASHILIRINSNDTLSAYKKADSILTKIKNGEDFAKLALKYSEDPGSRERGGDLGFFERRSVVPPFGTAAFSMKDGEVSNIVRTRFGYHIIKVTAHKMLPSFEDDKENLKKIFKQTRYDEEYDNLISELKNKYDFKIIGKTLDYLISNSDSAKVGADSSFMKKIDGMELYAFAGDSVDASSFLNELNANQNYSGRLINSQLLTDALKKISAQDLLEKEALNLEKTNHELRSLMEDYKNGIYIFKLQEEEVWNKINPDSVQLYQFYLDTKEDYKQPDRADYGEIFSIRDSIINFVYDKLKQGANFDSLAAKYTERPGFQAKAGHYGLQPVSSSTLAKKAFDLNEGEFTEPFENGNGYSIVKLFSKDPARLKTFEEAKPEVSSIYQEKESKKLEDQYINRLKERYHPIFYYDELSKAYKTE